MVVKEVRKEEGEEKKKKKKRRIKRKKECGCCVCGGGCFGGGDPRLAPFGTQIRECGREIGELAVEEWRSVRTQSAARFARDARYVRDCCGEDERLTGGD